MEPKHKFDYIQVGINISNLVKSTLGPKGMNKMVMKGKQAILTNDGATIIQNTKLDHPIGQLFQQLATSQEKAVGDGTTTAVILVGQLLERALELMNKNIHQTTIINGYNLARNECLKFIKQIQEKGDLKQIIRTCFGSKIAPELSDHLVKIFMQKIDPENLIIFKKTDASFEETKLINGLVFEAYTMNDRMPAEVEGHIAVLDFKSQLELNKFSITNAEELEKVNNLDREYKRKIVDKLNELNVKCVFYSDTNPEFESYLTEKGISGIVVYKRTDLDNICKATNAIVSSSPNEIEGHLGYGKMEFKKPNQITLTSKNSPLKTLFLCGTTNHVLEETERAVLDIVNLLKLEPNIVIGAGAIEIELSLYLKEFAKQIGGKEQIAIEKFAESLEAIPLILAENAGLDAIELVSILKTEHLKGNKTLGVDILKIISDAKERGIIEPSLMKMYLISNATDVANLILKLDEILVGEEEKK